MRSGPTEALLRGLALVLLVALIAPGALAETPAVDPTRAHGPTARALLIGVGAYPGLSREQQLLAPEGDARRLAAALAGAGLPQGNVEVMGGAGGVRPTRAAILKRLERLAAEAAQGDSVLVYFSGHGDQADPSPGGQAANLFLAADAGPANRTGARPGAITDSELRAAFAAILARGADLWFVADTCHAYGLVRAASGRVKGLPHRAREAAGAAPAALWPDRGAAGWGRFTGFYAAGEGALALERRLPVGAPDAEASSVFTYALVRAIGQGRVRSFRDLALATAAGETEVGPDAPAPVFEGDLDRPPPALHPADGRQFPLRRSGGELRLAAGALEGFDPGARVDLLTADGRSAGEARVVRAGLTEAILASSVAAEQAAAARLAIPAPPGATTRGERLLELAGTATSERDDAGIRLEAWLWRVRRTTVDPGRCPANPPLAQGIPAAAGHFELLSPPVLRSCDVIYLSLRNTGGAAVDASPLFVDAEGRIGALALSGDDGVRLAPGEARLAAVRLVDHDSVGRPLAKGAERLVVLVASANPDEPPADLRSLADAGPTRGRSSPLQAQLAAALDGQGRGGPWRPPDVAALVVPLRLP